MTPGRIQGVVSNGGSLAAITDLATENPSSRAGSPTSKRRGSGYNLIPITATGRMAVSSGRAHTGQFVLCAYPKVPMSEPTDIITVAQASRLRAESNAIYSAIAAGRLNRYASTSHGATALVSRAEVEAYRPIGHKPAGYKRVSDESSVEEK